MKKKTSHTKSKKSKNKLSTKTTGKQSAENTESLPAIPVEAEKKLRGKEKVHLKT